MAKVLTGVLIGIFLGALILLAVLAGLNPPIETQPEQVVEVIPEPVISPPPQQDEEPSPREEPIVDITPDFQSLKPQESHFWVNEIRVPSYTESYYNFIPVKQDDIKTFAGSFGPYGFDPRDWLTVSLCSEFIDVPASPACQRVVLDFVDNYVNFAVGLTYDEYIGGRAAKDYMAYYVVRSGDAVVTTSNRAMIRTVRD